MGLPPTEQVTPKPIQPRPWPVRGAVKGSAIAQILRTTDAKRIGVMYGVAALGYFIIGGSMALLMRAELAQPGLDFLSPEQYNQLFTVHGGIMLLLFATPIVFAFANFVVPCLSTVTKNSQLPTAGLAAPCSADLPGLLIGPIGRPAFER